MSFSCSTCAHDGQCNTDCGGACWSPAGGGFVRCEWCGSEVDFDDATWSDDGKRAYCCDECRREGEEARRKELQ